MGSRRRQSRSRVVRLRFTAAGWAFLIVTLAVAAATFKSQSAILFLIVGAMIGAMGVSGVMARRMLRGVDLDREMPIQAWQSETVHLGYYLRNTRKRSCLALAMEELPVSGIERTSGFCAHLPPGETFRSGARFVARRRGRVTLAGVQVVSRFPFGLVSGRRIVPRQASLVVWPARGRLKERMLHQGAVEVSTGPPTQATGGQDEFFGLRDYRSDDNPRWIHWRRSATRSVPVVREMCHPKPEILYVILDTRLPDASDSAWSQRERMIRFTGTLIEHALSRGYQAGLALAQGGRARAYPAAAGRGQLHLLLTALADIDDTTTLPLAATVAVLRRSTLIEAQVVLVAAAGGEAGVLRPLWEVCRNLSVVTTGRLPAVFQDDPLAAAQEAI
ncbi:MAG: DUF58 domain-containing protein [Phycisphaerae bacterium]|nr:DUF58 domain-containing protein [Phycisphaerae bacterium]